MTLGKWNNSGEVTWADGQVLTHTDLNNSIGEVMPPIGTVMAWDKSRTGGIASLPGCWVECDFSATVSDSDSPINGQTIPPINNATESSARHVRCNTTTNTTGGSWQHDHTVTNPGNRLHLDEYGTAGGYAHYNHSHDAVAGNNDPPQMDMVFILRVK